MTNKTIDMSDDGNILELYHRISKNKQELNNILTVDNGDTEIDGLDLKIIEKIEWETTQEGTFTFEIDGNEYTVNVSNLGFESIIYNWRFDDGFDSEVAKDSQGSEDGTISNLEWISDDKYVGGYALKSDGSSGSYLDVGTLGNYGSKVFATNNWAWAVTVDLDDSVTASADILGVRGTWDGESNSHQTIQYRSDTKLRVLIADIDDNRERVDFDVPDLTNGPHRIIVNRNFSGPEGIEMYVNGESRDVVEIGNDSSIEENRDWVRELYFFARHDPNGSTTAETPGIIDNPYFTDAPLTESEINQDYENQHLYLPLSNYNLLTL